MALKNVAFTQNQSKHNFRNGGRGDLLKVAIDFNVYYSLRPQFVTKEPPCSHDKKYDTTLSNVHRLQDKLLFHIRANDEFKMDSFFYGQLGYQLFRLVRFQR